MPPRKQKKVSRILQHLVAPAVSDEEDGSASQQPSPIPRDEAPSSAVVGASLLLLSEAQPSIVAPRTKDLPARTTSISRFSPAYPSSKQPASELPTKRKGKGRGKKSTPSLDIDPRSREEPALHD